MTAMLDRGGIHGICDPARDPKMLQWCRATEHFNNRLIEGMESRHSGQMSFTVTYAEGIVKRLDWTFTKEPTDTPGDGPGPVIEKTETKGTPCEAGPERRPKCPSTMRTGTWCRIAQFLTFRPRQRKPE